jgi:hypothetical protein
MELEHETTSHPMEDRPRAHRQSRFLVQPLVAAFLRPLDREPLIATLVGGVGVECPVHVVAGRQPIAAMRDLCTSAAGHAVRYMGERPGWAGTVSGQVS